jgi:rare lipoprotein A
MIRRRGPVIDLGIILCSLVAACAGPRAVGVQPPGPVSVGYEQTGEASWYGAPYHGRRTASGEVYDMDQMTAAHQSLPLGTWVSVENLDNGRIADVRINDRGPFAGNRILDLSRAAARMLDAVGPGVIPVRLHVIALPGAARAARSGSFAVQAGSFTSRDRALALRDELDRAWAGALVVPAEVGERTLYRVRLAGFAARSDAQRVAEQLARAGYTVIIVGE